MMIQMRWAGLAALALLTAVPAAAEEEDSAVQAVLRAILLPQAAADAREAGVPDEEVRTVLAEAHRDGVSAERTEAVIREGTRRVRDGEPAKNFGQTVKAMIRDGYRGRDLATAIHEHKAVMRAAKDNAKGKARPAAGNHDAVADHDHAGHDHAGHDHADGEKAAQKAPGTSKKKSKDGGE